MTTNSAAPSSKFATVLRVTSGNFMEMFDFFLFGFYATYISKAFFPSDNEFASLMLTFGTFGAGFLMRPLGAIILGAYVDRVGRRPLLIVFTVLTILTVYPAMSWLVSDATFTKMLIVELWLSFLYASYNGAMVVALTEVMPVSVRTAGFSLAYSLATAIFGGFTPAIATGLIEVTQNKAAPALWMSFAAVCGLTATLILYSKKSQAARPA